MSRLEEALDDLWGCIGTAEIGDLQPETVLIAQAIHERLWHGAQQQLAELGIEGRDMADSDDDDRDIWAGPATDPVFGAHLGDVVLVNVHPETVCEGRHCVLHNPSDHHMRDWPTLWRADRRLMERTCPHGVGHPDPDDLAYQISEGRTWQADHGCDGCCRP